MKSFALYRLPWQQQVVCLQQTQGDPAEFASMTDLNEREGYVMAPFSISESHPALIIRPDVVRVFNGDAEEIRREIQVDTVVTGALERPTRTDYAVDFSHFHAQLINGRFRKIVLSRCAVEEKKEDADAISLFVTACENYPRLFVALVYTPQSGLWLTATPEILLEGDADRHWRTIALAGTMELHGDELQGEGEHVRWSVKNIEEQRMVATYIEACLKPFATSVVEEGPKTVRAASLVHLRSDFTFDLSPGKRVGDLLQALHPTPAVCGLPKDETFTFIMSHEHAPRQYYSGFQGPLMLHGETHLFVSLRCMKIERDAYRLYAGGGLLKDSVEEQEWQETEAKMETMRRCIATKSI